MTARPGYWALLVLVWAAYALVAITMIGAGDVWPLIAAALLGIPVTLLLMRAAHRG